DFSQRNGTRQQTLGRAVALLVRLWCGTGPADGAQMCLEMVLGAAAIMVSRDTKRTARRDSRGFPPLSRARPRAARLTGAPNPAGSVLRWVRRQPAAQPPWL